MCESVSNHQSSVGQSAGRIVRAAVHTDAGAIADIYNHHVLAGGATFDVLPWTATQVSELLLIKSPETWVVCVDGEQMLGWASARQFSIRYGFRMSLEWAIYLSPEAIGKGVANSLIVDVEQRCRDGQVHHLMSRVIATNQRSMAFHYRHGYELVGVQKEIGNLDNQWIDLAILQKIL
ncbi:GNAT family N-acetyltransferase [Rubripirellula reticaptiva]|uniref:GNAT family N-acetyltransferase n=1 Tax=Rubripirellula reticaptiva TaxID=2528013 RepID=UPI0016470478|nr:GNAT family N-acetyltransferase [Rubripirellula reticaptiva]